MALGLALALPFNNGGEPIGSGDPTRIYAMSSMASAIYDFANQRYYTRDAALNTGFTEATFASLFTFTRASSATYIGSDGTLQTATTNVARFNYDPVSLQPKGILIEAARTNLLLNSLLDGTLLSTQSVTTTAIPYSLSFYGTGTVALAGAFSFEASLVGTGAYPTRSILVFTPTAGTLTLTVTGTVQFANLEAGDEPTSFVPTAGAAVTRAVDVCNITGLGSATWFSAAAFSELAQIYAPPVLSTAAHTAVGLTNGTSSDRFELRRSVSGFLNTTSLAGSVSQISQSTANMWGNDSLGKMAARYATNDYAFTLNAGTVVTDTVCAVPTITELDIGYSSGVAISQINSSVGLFVFYPSLLTNAQLQQVTG